MTIDISLDLPSEATLGLSSGASLDLSSEEFDVIIIGGGPAGLSAALYAARSQLKTIVLDKNPTAGALGSTDKIENYPGIPERMKGSELLSMFREQAQKFGASVKQAQVVGVNFEKDIKEVITSDRTYSGKTVIIATGSMGRNPTIKGEAEFTGRGVSYCAACDAPFFAGKDVAVIGDIDEILEEINLIAKFARTIYVIPRKKVTLEQNEILNIPHVEVMYCRVIEIVGTNTVEGIRIMAEKKEQILNVSGAFIFLHGANPITGFLYNAVDITDQGCIKVNKEDMSSSVEGVYAVGDVTCKKFRQVVIAASEGCIAALSADKYINRRKQVRPQWS
ncbi:MAG: FAD-dependent oxidoreductase [Theionarchaea archaeon]|nr:FAD-dependent oxidoreductase [Theionarchaea archaeon]